MDTKTAVALEDSIEKWKMNLSYAEAGTLKHITMSAITCPLCSLFYRDYMEDAPCSGCPVYERSGVEYCKETPYPKALAELNACKMEIYEGREVSTESLIAAVKAEVEFLESLQENDRGPHNL